MSHIVQAKTAIRNPNLALLGEALQIVAGAHQGGRVDDHILNYYRREQAVNTHLAVYTKKIQRGIGIDLTPAGEMQSDGSSRVLEMHVLWQRNGDQVKGKTTPLLLCNVSRGASSETARVLYFRSIL